MPAPDPEGDVVPGNPPVPISVWHLPRPPGTPLVSADLTRRLIANYTRPGATVLDLTSSVPAHVPADAKAELVITQWPPPDAAVASTDDATPDPCGHLAACAARLTVHGCVAVVVADPDIHDLLAVLVTAAHDTGLTYLQHIVVVHQLDPPAGDLPRRVDVARLPSGRRHLRVHTDLIILRRPDPGARPRPGAARA